MFYVWRILNTQAAVSSYGIMFFLVQTLWFTKGHFIQSLGEHGKVGLKKKKKKRSGNVKVVHSAFS